MGRHRPFQVGWLSVRNRHYLFFSHHSYYIPAMKNINRFPPYTMLLTYSGMLLFYLGGAALFSSSLRLMLSNITPWMFARHFDWIVFLLGVALLIINLFRVRSYSLKRTKNPQEGRFGIE